MVKVSPKTADTDEKTGKKLKKRKIKRKKISNIKEIDSEDERVKKRLNAKFSVKTQRPGDDGVPRLRISKKEHILVKNSEKHDVLLKRSRETVLNRLNQVECREVTISTRWKCALCQQRSLRFSLGDLFGPYMIRLEQNYWPTHLAKRTHKISKQAQVYCDLWLHGPCALSAPGIFLVGSQLAGLQSKINTFWSQRCAVCSKEGAAVEDRGKHYHYPCAVQKDLQMMDKVACEQQEIAVVVVWDWASVQIPLDKINLFVNKIRTTIVENLDAHPRECAFLVYCDARFTPLAVTRELEKSANVDIHHIESHESAWGICKKLHRFHIDYDPGVVALISGASAAYGPVLTKLSRCGWRVQLFYPENAPKDYVDYGDHNWPVERLLGGEIGNVNGCINFPHTVYFLARDLCNSDISLGFLSNVTEQYESKVVYFNEKTAEAVVELKAFDVESAVSLLEARVRARSPNVGTAAVSATDTCRLEMLASAHFLSNIKIAKLTKDSSEKDHSVQYPSAPADVTSLEDSIGNTLSAATTALTPYPMPPLSLMQQLAFPFRLDIASAAASVALPPGPATLNIAAAANAAILQPHATTGAAFHPYAAVQIAAAASHLLHQQHTDEHHNNYGMIDTIDEYNRNENQGLEEDSKSHKEAKIEVFSEDEDDYGDDDDTCDPKENAVLGNRNGWELDCNRSMDENVELEVDPHQFYNGTLSYNTMEYVSEYPPFPVTGSEGPLCYSAVVKGIKPLSTNNRSSFNPLKDCSNAMSQRNTSNMSSVSTQMSQWDQMVVERGGKFNKPAPQCIHWNNPKHRLDFPCRFWHPREQCRYYPNCSNTADECGFAHPFCGDFCRCPKGKRDPQKNHRVPEERYFGGGDRMKYGTSNNTQ